MIPPFLPTSSSRNCTFCSITVSRYFYKIFHFNMKEIKMNNRTYKCIPMHRRTAGESAVARAISTATKWRTTLKYGSKSHATAAASCESGLCKWMRHNATQVYLTLTHSFALTPTRACPLPSAYPFLELCFSIFFFFLFLSFSFHFHDIFPLLSKWVP